MAKENVARNNIWKWLVLALVAVVSFYVCNPPAEKVRLGLDLNGGTSFTLGVDTEKLAESIIAAKPELAEKPEQVQEMVAKTLEGCDDRIIQVIRRRVDSMGTNEPVIQLSPTSSTISTPTATSSSSTRAGKGRSSQAMCSSAVTALSFAAPSSRRT